MTTDTKTLGMTIETTCHSELCLQRRAIEESQNSLVILSCALKDGLPKNLNTRLSFWVGLAWRTYEESQISNVAEIPRYARNDSKKEKQ